MARDVFPVPVPPSAPDAPAVPNADKIRARVRIPRSTVPAYENLPFLTRYAQWQAEINPLGSLPEYIVWEYLTEKKQWKNGIDFYYQYPLYGGRTRYGGFVADYFISRGLMIWNVQGLHFHLLEAVDRAKDLAFKALLSQRGYRVIYLWEDDLLERANYIIEAALQGQESNRHKDEVGLYT